MATTGKKLVELDGEELKDLLGLVGGSDSVELKLTIPEPEQRNTVDALKLDPLDAQIRQVFFFDTPDLELNKVGVVARARRVQGRVHDSVVKLRPVVPETLPEKFRAAPTMNVEVDAMPGGYVCSASLKGEVEDGRIWSAVHDGAPISKIFSKKQRKFFEKHAPEGVELDDLAILGPIFVLKVKFRRGGFDRTMVAEVWLYPDGERILELSTKCAPDEMFNVAEHARAYLEGEGIDLSGEQQTKTKTALTFYATKLKAEAAAA